MMINKSFNNQIKIIWTIKKKNKMMSKKVHKIFKKNNKIFDLMKNNKKIKIKNKKKKKK